MNPPGIYTLYMDPYPGRSWSQYLVLAFVVALTNLTQDSGLRHRAVEHKSSHNKMDLFDSGTAGMYCVPFWTIGAEKAAFSISSI